MAQFEVIVVVEDFFQFELVFECGKMDVAFVGMKDGLLRYQSKNIENLPEEIDVSCLTPSLPVTPPSLAALERALEGGRNFVRRILAKDLELHRVVSHNAPIHKNR